VLFGRAVHPRESAEIDEDRVAQIGLIGSAQPSHGRRDMPDTIQHEPGDLFGVAPADLPKPPDVHSPLMGNRSGERLSDSRSESRTGSSETRISLDRETETHHQTVDETLMRQIMTPYFAVWITFQSRVQSNGGGARFQKDRVAGCLLNIPSHERSRWVIARGGRARAAAMSLNSAVRRHRRRRKGRMRRGRSGSRRITADRCLMPPSGLPSFRPTPRDPRIIVSARLFQPRSDRRRDDHRRWTQVRRRKLRQHGHPCRSDIIKARSPTRRQSR
jgi:hypothetical protein